MTEPETPNPPESADKIPKHTTPTWEVEMIISGAAVFAMLQLPGWLNESIGMLIPRFDHAWASVLQLLSIYWVGAAVVLAITFTVHLSLRAHWIALVGTHSVFPDGVRWFGLRFGPVERDLVRKKLGSAEDAIEHADNRATIVFAVGVSFASFLIALSVIGALLAAVIIAFQSFADPGTIYVIAVVAVALLLGLPYPLARRYDRKVGAQLPTDSRKRQRLNRIFRTYAHIGIGRRTYAWAVLSSHIGERRQKVIVSIMLAALLGLIGLTSVVVNWPNMLGNYGLFPDATGTSHALRSAYYDDERDITRGKATPYIQSEVISGPYLRLVVPWQPSDDNAAVKRECAKAIAMSDAGKRVTSTLDCLAKLHAVSVDGNPLSGLRYDAGSDPRTQRPALVAMIDVRALTPGRHQLDVKRVPPAHRDGSIDVEPVGITMHLKRHDKHGPDVIPFWR